MTTTLIQQLYRIERRAKEEKLDRARLFALRQGESQPVLENLGELLQLFAEMRPPKTPFGAAMKYAKGQRPATIRYLEVPETELDNNRVYAARGIDRVVVDFDPPIPEVHHQPVPLAQRVGDRLAQRALRQVPRLELLQGAVQPLHDHPALCRPGCFPEAATSPLFPHPGFDPVKGLDLPQDPSGLPR